MVHLGWHEGSLVLIKPVRSPSIIALERDTALGEDCPLASIMIVRSDFSCTCWGSP